MRQKQMGVNVALAGGNDTAIGTAYADSFEMGSGINYVDGGRNLGTASYSGRDVIQVFLTRKEDLDGVSVVTLDGAGSQEDVVAHAAGYTDKLVSLATEETTYFKNVELVVVQHWDDKNNNGQRDWDNAEITTIKQFVVGPFYTANTPSPTAASPFFGFGFGSSKSETMDAKIASLYEFDVRSEDLQVGLYLYGGLGNNTLLGTDRHDLLMTHDLGSNRIDGRGDEGYYRFGSTVSQHSDGYRLFVQKATAKTISSDVAGGFTASDLEMERFSLVDVRGWTEAFTTINAETTGLTNRLPNGGALSQQDLVAIGLKAQELDLTGSNLSEGVEWVVVKRDTVGGNVTGVDFLQDIETIQFSIWFDRNNDTRPSAGTNSEFVNVVTYQIKADTYQLSEADRLENLLGPRDGVWIGSIFDDTVDLTQLGMSSGYRVIDNWGDDRIKGTNFDDFFILGRGDDFIDGAGGIDRAGVSWESLDDSALLSLDRSQSDDGVVTVTVSEFSAGVSRELLTLVSIDASTWRLSDSEVGAVNISPLNDRTGTIGTDTLKNIEFLSIYKNAVTSAPAALDLDLTALYVGV